MGAATALTAAALRHSAAPFLGLDAADALAQELLGSPQWIGPAAAAVLPLLLENGFLAYVRNTRSGDHLGA